MTASCLTRSLFLSALLVSACHTRTGPGVADTVGTAGATRAFEIVDLSPLDGDLTTVLAREAVKARAAGQRPYVEVGATWCGPCLKLKASLDDARMVEAFRGTRILRLDLDAWQPQLLGAGFRVDVIPVFIQLSGEGKPTTRTLTGEAWKEDTVEGMAPVLQKFLAG